MSIMTSVDHDIGTLSADDATEGSGSDQAEIQWIIRYTGPLGDETILLKVEILEEGAEPANFVTIEDRLTIEVDPTVQDKDYDGIPDNFESAHGLDITTNDSSKDLDGDGISNIAEYTLGTDPSNADSDGDGLNDREEIVGGIDGAITDPLNVDTDGDGTNDDKDGQPNDAGSVTASSTTSEEPRVSLELTSVNITESQPRVSIIIRNSGTGDLYWQALSDNEALVETSSNPLMPQQEGTLFLSVPKGFDFVNTPTITTQVKVVDASGLDPDFQTITVRVVGQGAGPIGVPADLTDAIIVLQIVAGIVPHGSIPQEADVNGDNRIGIEEAVHILQRMAK